MSAPIGEHLTPGEIDAVASVSAEDVDRFMAEMFTRLGLPSTPIDEAGA